MVQKSKGGKKCRSSLAGKKKKNKMKHHRKDNFKKKKKEKMIECCVCMEEIKDCSDNVVTCGKVNHPLCGVCKLKCKDCPMCRSHSVRAPISQVVNIPILSSSSKIQGEFPKKKIFVDVGPLETGSGNSWSNLNQFDGIYHEIRRNKQNYPIYKKLDEEKYIVNEWGRADGDTKDRCLWVFCLSPDGDDETYYMVKSGKLMGSHWWGDGVDYYVFLTITRI